MKEAKPFVFAKAIVLGAGPLIGPWDLWSFLRVGFTFEP